MNTIDNPIHQTTERNVQPHPDDDITRDPRLALYDVISHRRAKYWPPAPFNIKDQHELIVSLNLGRIPLEKAEDLPPDFKVNEDERIIIRKAELCFALVETLGMSISVGNGSVIWKNIREPVRAFLRGRITRAVTWLVERTVPDDIERCNQILVDDPKFFDIRRQKAQKFLQLIEENCY